MKRILILSLITLFFINTNAYSASLFVDASERTPKNAAFRSLLMPGWGQLWNEQPTKAVITFGIFAGSVFAAFHFNHESERYYEKYEEQGLINGAFYKDYEDNYRNSQIFTYIAIGTWIYGIVDAFFTTKKQIKNSPKISSVKINYNKYNNGLYLMYSRKVF